MPLLYTKAMEIVAQGMHWVDVPEHDATVPEVFKVRDIREEVIRTHVSMGRVRNDGESHRNYRFADHTLLDEPTQRARLKWKSRRRFVIPSEKPPEHDWKALQTVWPHHSLRGEDWTVCLV